MRLFRRLAPILIVALVAGACGSSKVNSNSTQAQAKAKVNAELQLLRREDPNAPAQVTYAENHLAACVRSVHGRVKTHVTAFLSCEGLSQQEIARAQPCLTRAADGVTPGVIRDPNKRTELVIGVVKCTTR